MKQEISDSPNPIGTGPLPRTENVPVAGRKRIPTWAMVLGIPCVVIGTVVTALALFPGIIPLGPYRANLEKTLSDMLGRPTRIESLKLVSLFNPTVEAAEVKIKDDPAFSAEDFIVVGRLRCRFSISGFFSSAPRPSSVDFENARIHLFRKLDGTWNWSSLKGFEKRPAAPPTTGTQSPVASIRGDVRSLFHNRQAAPPSGQAGVLIETVSFREISLRVVTESEPEVEEGEPSTSPAPPEKGGVVQVVSFQSTRTSGGGCLYADRFDCPKLEAEIAGGRFVGKSKLIRSGDMFDFEVEGEVRDAEMKDLFAGIASKTYIRGKANSTLSLKGQFAAGQSVGRTLTGSGRLEIRDGEFPTVRIGEFKSEKPNAGKEKPGESFPFPKLPFPNQLRVHARSRVPEAHLARDEEKIEGKQSSKPTGDPSGAPAGTKFELLTCEFNLTPGTLETTKLMCKTSDESDVQGDGKLEFGDEVTTVEYLLNASMTQETFAKLQKSRPVASAVSLLLSRNRILRLPVRVSGDIRRPEVEVDYAGFLRMSGGSDSDGLLKKLPIPEKLPLPF